MTLRLNGSTSGYVEIDAPAIAGTTLLTAPAASGTLDRLNRAGNVLQVVQATITSELSTTSTSMIDIPGLSVSITPSSSTNKILVLVNLGTVAATSNSQFGSVDILRGASLIHEMLRLAPYSSNGNIAAPGGCGVILDSPATTASTTYKCQYRVSAGTFFLNYGGSDSSITLLEIAA